MGTGIAIIGDGAMGTLCGKLLIEKGCRVRLWSAFEENAAELKRTRRNRRFLPGVDLPAALEVTADPAEAFPDAELVVSAVPTQFTRGVWQRLEPHCPPGLPICSVTKGIENGTLLRPTQILAEVLTGSAEGDWPLVALSGPSIARELARQLPATVVAASVREPLAAQVQQLFTTSYLRVYTNTDVVGVEIAAATKNIIAIAAGILDGLQAGDNAKAALITRGLAEISRLGLALGGRRETFAGLAGLGDLVTTCVSPHGRNRTFGQAVGTGQTVRQARAAIEGEVEGVATTHSVVDLAARHRVDLPITRAVHAVLFEGCSPRQAIAQLMSRPLKGETE
jgi:glycerol-3-phosphate dehydrogenase (NAD(P)+)